MHRKLELKTIIKIFTKRKGDLLNKLFIFCFVYFSLYSIFLISIEAPSLAVYRFGKYISDLSLGIIVSYIFYFMSIVIPFEQKLYIANSEIRKHSEDLMFNLNLLLERIFEDDKWNERTRSENIQRLSVIEKSKDLYTESYAVKDMDGTILINVNFIEWLYYKLHTINEILLRLEKYNQYITNEEIRTNLNFLYSSDLHKLSIRLYKKMSIPEYIEREYYLMKYILYGSKLNNDIVENDYVYKIRRLEILIDCQVNDVVPIQSKSPNTTVSDMPANVKIWSGSID